MGKSGPHRVDQLMENGDGQFILSPLIVLVMPLKEIFISVVHFFNYRTLMNHLNYLS